MSVAKNNICRRKMWNDDFCFCPACTEIQKRIIAEQLKNRNNERNTISQLERVHLKRQSRNLVTVLEGKDSHWCEDELNYLCQMWDAGLSLRRQSNHFNRDEIETLMAIIHLWDTDKITTRREGVFG